jgi:hypothetical protein
MEDDDRIDLEDDGRSSTNFCLSSAMRRIERREDFMPGHHLGYSIFDIQ